jgi:GLEYA domain
VGQHGLRRKLYNTTYDLTWNLLSTSTDFTEMLSMDLEAPVNVKSSGYGNNYQGYFKAPATASYRFYMSCDDYCQLYFSNANMDPSKKALILGIGWNTAYRNYFTVDGKRISAWLNLTKDEYYFIELRHIQGSGGDHVTVSVEIQDPTLVSGH